MQTRAAVNGEPCSFQIGAIGAAAASRALGGGRGEHASHYRAEEGNEAEPSEHPEVVQPEWVIEQGDSAQ